MTERRSNSERLNPDSNLHGDEKQGKTTKPLQNGEQNAQVVSDSQILLNILWPPIAIIGFHLLCNNSQCSFFMVPNWNHFSSSNFFNMKSFIYVWSFAISMALWSMLPFGGQKVKSLNKNDDFIYVTNGLSFFVTAVICILSLEYFRFPISKHLVEHTMSVVVSLLLYVIFISVFIYLKSFNAPVEALNHAQINSSVLSNFCNGREINTRLYGLDFKVYLARFYSISFVIMDIAFLIHSLGVDLQSLVTNLDWTQIKIHPTLILLIIFHCSYFSCHLIFERRLMSTHFVRYEGMGYDIFVGSFIWWSGLVAQTGYILHHQIHYPNWQLMLLAVVYYFGFFYFLRSNKEKNDFRSDPKSSPSFKSIPTNQGKDILCSGTWGVVRQPNIATDILVHLTWFRFGWSVPPVIAVLALIKMLLDRSVMSQDDCSNRYGTAWEKYCQKVKYILIPFVY